MQHPTGTVVFTTYDPIRGSVWQMSKNERSAYTIARSPLFDVERADHDLSLQIRSVAAARWYARPNVNMPNNREWVEDEDLIASTVRSFFRSQQLIIPQTMYPWDASCGSTMPGLRPPRRILFHTRRCLEGKDGISMTMLMNPRERVIQSELVDANEFVLSDFVSGGFGYVWLRVVWPASSKYVQTEKIFLRMVTPEPYPKWAPITRMGLGRQVAQVISRHVEHVSRDPEWVRRGLGSAALTMSRLRLVSLWEIQWGTFVAEISFSTMR
ncbi:hypothetical protein C8Q73DRAFT_345060 [Cubamyces lactineus]|nr:hypothetical protein C8Q73DRAFT_345060 [Cubamyces lactineus]